MQRVRYQISIDAPADTVWHALLDDAPYREWTSEFAAGSHYVGAWDEGEKMHFLAPDDEGRLGAMVARIREVRPERYLSIEHLGVVQDGVEDTTSEAVAAWAGNLENYTLTPRGEATEVLVEIDLPPEHAAMFGDSWPRALLALKRIAEGEPVR